MRVCIGVQSHNRNTESQVVKGNICTPARRPPVTTTTTGCLLAFQCANEIFRKKTTSPKYISLKYCCTKTKKETTTLNKYIKNADGV